ncbi:MAG: hypothetical protein WC614_11525 [bacterium]
MKRLLAGIAVLVIVGCGNNSTPPKKEFTPPVDNKITTDKADSYVQASKFLMEAIKKQETSLQKFIKRWKLSNDLSELSDSTYTEKNPQVVKSWNRLQDQWRRAELSAYDKASLGEDEFNWIGGALADSINIDIQSRIQKQLQ